MKKMLSFILILALAFSMASVPGIAGASSTVKRELIRFSSYASTDTDCDLFGFYVGDGNSAKRFVEELILK